MTLHTGRLTVLLCAVLVFISYSCSDPNSLSSPDGMGKVMASLCSEVVVKSTESPSGGAIDNYNFRFVGVDTYGTSDYYRYGSVSWPMDWYFGIYRIQAESCTRDEAEFHRGKLRYEGIGDAFSVINGQTATASVVCRVANFQVKVNFDDSMYEAFDDFKLTVQSFAGEQLYRTLDFDAIEKSGYYNLHEEPLLLRYMLYVKNDGASVFMESATGYFSATDESEPSVVVAGDIVTFNVKYAGQPVVSDGIKFIVGGERTKVSTSLQLPEYNNGIVTEDE